MGWFTFFFFVSGFCGLLYELTWLRLAMAQFGVTSALVSIVISAFMSGLGIGSWGAGRLLIRVRRGGFLSPLRLYAAAELLIGISALLVPHELATGRSLLRGIALSSSTSYYLGSGAWLALTLVPWCACMGATIPIGMAAIGTRPDGERGRSFSYLYVANVAGALAGATIPLFLIEVLGFRGTARVAAMLNGTLAVLALALDGWPSSKALPTAAVTAPRSKAEVFAEGRVPVLTLLFLTGFTSMGMEVVWIRQLTPYLGTMVYAFGLVLATYLGATFVGSRLYRSLSQGQRGWSPMFWSLLGVAALLALISANPSLFQIRAGRWMRLALGVGPVSILFGIATPMLIDRWSGGDPDRAGRAYAVNVLGCITGPLVAGFVLLPQMQERWVLALFSLPWLVVGLLPRGGTTTRERFSGTSAWSRWVPFGAVALSLLMVGTSHGYEDQFPDGVVLRDNTATVVATQASGHKRLIVNGQGMTYLTPITKMMAHLPLASLDHAPARGLVICFGMGTTFRSMLSWGIPTTVVELVPSVPLLFGYFHDDGPEALRSPLAHVVIDDGRRFLERTSEYFDVIAIDPPPPIEAAGSSLLYSRELYTTLKTRLRPGGIVQQWFSVGDDIVEAAILGALRASFAYVRVFRSLEGSGLHYLASERPIPVRTASELVQRMPARAVRDLMEWGPAATPEEELALMVELAATAESASPPMGSSPSLVDDRPINEYFLLRHLLKKGGS